MNATICACVLWICVVAGAAGYFKREVFGKCVSVCKPSDPIWIKKMFRYCISDSKCTYCKYYGCPELKECKRGQLIIPPMPTPARNCMICPGTCAYGGKSYKKRDRFKSVDDFNECKCLHMGKVRCSTKHTPSPKKYCGV